IRDDLVTGVQTCALPISGRTRGAAREARSRRTVGGRRDRAQRLSPPAARAGAARCGRAAAARWALAAVERRAAPPHAAGGIDQEIGRASCRERVERAGGE